METSTIIWMAVGNFCIFPLLVFAIGVWVGHGMPGSPVVLMRRNAHDTPQHPDDDDEYEYEEL